MAVAARAKGKRSSEPGGRFGVVWECLGVPGMCRRPALGGAGGPILRAAGGGGASDWARPTGHAGQADDDSLARARLLLDQRRDGRCCCCFRAERACWTRDDGAGGHFDWRARASFQLKRRPRRRNTLPAGTTCALSARAACARLKRPLPRIITSRAAAGPRQAGHFVSFPAGANHSLQACDTLGRLLRPAHAHAHAHARALVFRSDCCAPTCE